MQKKNLKIIFIIFLSLLLNHKSYGKECIGMAMASTGHFWEAIRKGGEIAGKANGLKVWSRGTKDEQAMQNQEKIIKFLLQKKCRGLVIAPNITFTKERAKQLTKAGINFVFVDRSANIPDITTIKTDNYSAGVKAGEAMVDKLKGSGVVAIFRFKKGLPSTSKRVAGFINTVKMSGIKVEEFVLGTTVSIVRDKFQKWLKEHKPVNGIFTPNEQTTLGVLLTKYNFKAVHIGFDFHDEYIESVNTGKLYGFVIQKPMQMGQMAVQALIEKTKGNPTPGTIETPTLFVNKKNIDLVK